MPLLANITTARGTLWVRHASVPASEVEMPASVLTAFSHAWQVHTQAKHVFKVGQNRIRTPYMTICIVCIVFPS